jgi:hypothetical protein
MTYRRATVAVAFWRAVGYRDDSLKLEIVPPDVGGA